MLRRRLGRRVGSVRGGGLVDRKWGMARCGAVGGGGEYSDTDTNYGTCPLVIDTS